MPRTLPKFSTLSPPVPYGLGPLPPGPLGGLLVYTSLFCYQTMTLIDKLVHYIFSLLFGPILKLVYFSSEVEKKVTLFCIIYILVLLTHICIRIWYGIGDTTCCGRDSGCLPYSVFFFVFILVTSTLEPSCTYILLPLQQTCCVYHILGEYEFILSIPMTSYIT